MVHSYVLQYSTFYAFSTIRIDKQEQILHSKVISNVVRLGPNPKLKLEEKGLDQSRTLNSLKKMCPHHPPTNFVYQFHATHTQYIILVFSKEIITMKILSSPQPHLTKNRYSFKGIAQVGHCALKYLDMLPNLSV